MAIKYPRTQGLNSPTFTPPYELLERESTILADLYEFNVEHNADHPFFRFWDGSQTQDLTWGTMGKAFYKTARLIKSQVKLRGDEEQGRPPVVAILTSSDSITYTCMIIGMIYMGYVPFVISTRNNAAAVAHLLLRTKARHLYMSGDHTIQALRQATFAELKEEDRPTTYAMPIFEDIFGDGLAGLESLRAEEKFTPVRAEPNDPLLIMHSSGSTAFPKPIPWIQRSLVSTTYVPWFGECDVCGWVYAIHAAPMFHGLGLLQLGVISSIGIILAVYKPQSPPVIPTPENLWEGVLQTKADLVLSVPVFVQYWAKDPAKVAHLPRMKGVVYGGGPLNQEVGDQLAREGVNIISVYGLTEVGGLNNVFPKNPRLDWEYLEVSPTLDVAFVHRGDDLYELIAKTGNIVFPAVTNTKIDGVDAYATSDLFAQHPTRPGLWKIVGRADDQIVLSNSEKVNPVPLENVLLDDPHIQAVVLFGRGRFQVGVLIEPKAEYVFDPSDQAKLEQFRNMIWPSVERMNGLAPQHGRLFKEMILVASLSKQFQYTAKLTPRRQYTLNLYEAEIDALYDAVDEASQADIKAPAEWTAEGVREFVRSNVTSVLQKQVPDDADIFEHGGDSLQATWIRNTILRALREPHPAAVKNLPVNMIYQTPTINGLVDTVLAAIHQRTNGTEDGTSAESKTDEMQRKVEEYSAAFPACPPPATTGAVNGVGGDVVLVTGTTSGFGCDALAHLLQDVSVTRVYAFNRRLPDVEKRQQTSFKDRGLDEGLLSSPKYRSVEGDTSVAGFGIDPALFEEICDSITHIIHNAWRVDFKLALTSFEANLKGVRNLIDLALASPHGDPPRLLFVSSIGTFMNWTSSALAPEEPIADPAIAVGQGYTESKWVAEHVLLRAARETGLRPVIVRLGQMAGDRRGWWNEHEWLPALVKASVVQGALPDFPGQFVTWIPAYEASAALLEMRNAPAHADGPNADPVPVLHLMHPRPLPWSTLVLSFAKVLGLPLITYPDWVAALRRVSLPPSSDSDYAQTRGPTPIPAPAVVDDVAAMRANPALRLLKFFEGAQEASTQEGREAIGLARLAVERAVRVSPTLAGVPQVDEENVRAWIGAWRASGFLPGPAATS